MRKVDLDTERRCEECGYENSMTKAGICLRCVGNIIRGRPMRTALGQEIAVRINRSLSTDTR